MITVDFSKRGTATLTDFLYEFLKKSIITGTLQANEKLPSKRSLANHLGISVITVQNVYSLLLDEGYIYSIERTGIFVTDIKTDITISKINHTQYIHNEIKYSENKNEISWLADFSSNAIGEEKFPFSLWAKTMKKIINNNDKRILKKTDAKGVYELRYAISKHLKEFRNMNVSPENIVIGAGTESIYTTIIQLLGINHIYAVENPGFKKISLILELNKAKWQPVDIDNEGMKLTDLEKSEASIAHVSPAHHFPTGIVMSARRRNELLLWANKTNGRYIIEDEYDSEFRFNGKPLSTLQSADKNDSVIYVNTFSKSLAPSFKISYMILPDTLLKKYEEKFETFSNPVSAFEQFTLAEFILSGNFAKHIFRMKNYYRSLRNEIIKNFLTKETNDKIKIYEENSGLHFIFSVIKKDFNIENFQNQLKSQKINIPLLKNFYYTPVPEEKENFFVLNYSGIKNQYISEVIKKIISAL